MRITFFLTAMLAIMTACGTTPDTATMTSVVDEVKTQKINELQSRFNNLTADHSNSGIATAAMLGDTVDGPCTLYTRWKSLHAVQVDYDNLGYDGTTDFSTSLNEAVRTAAQKATGAAYERMKNGDPLSCKGLESTQFTLFNNLAKLMDEYGRPADTEAFDPAIIRTACLREIQPDVTEILAAIEENENSDTLGWLTHYAETVKNTWNFTSEEIGVPKTLIGRLDL